VRTEAQQELDHRPGRRRTPECATTLRPRPRPGRRRPRGPRRTCDSIAGVASALDLAAELGHERVLLISDRAAGLRAVVAIHSTTLGPGVGGTRVRAYPSFDGASSTRCCCRAR